MSPTPLELRSLTLNDRFRSDQEDVVANFFVPAFTVAASYSRTGGYFTSTSLALYARGIETVVERGGSMRLIASPHLNEDDIIDIERGYDTRGVAARATARELDFEQCEGRQMPLSALVETITGKYSVSANSVAAYASAMPFETKNGIAHIASGERTIHKTPERTRQSFRRTNRRGYRIRINSDLPRCSGSPALIVLAGILGLHARGTLRLTSRLGPQVAARTAIQLTLGTIREFLLDGDIAADTDTFLVVRDDQTFDFVPCREMTGDAIVDALASAGAEPSVNRSQARQAFAADVRLPEASSVARIISAYGDRGDADVADLLLQEREYLESGVIATAPQRASNVDEILDLL